MNFYSKLWVLAGVVAMLMSGACVDRDEFAAPRLPAPAAGSGGVQGDGGFSSSVLPVLIEYCSECHNPSDQTAGFDLTTFASVAASGSLVVAGDADGSLLVQVLESNSMPPVGRPGPSAAEIAIIRAWVAAGAPNN